MRKLKLEELGRISVEEFKNAQKLPVCIVLDNVRSLYNVGSAFRTADAFRVEKIFLAGITGTPPHREIEKSALGATASVAWTYTENVLAVVNQLRQEGYKILAVEQTTQSAALDTIDFKSFGKVCLIFGNEVNGVSEEVIALADAAIEIPQAGTKHSLNISVCVGIVLWQVYQQLRLNQS